jgi:hypothetical protein
VSDDTRNSDDVKKDGGALDALTSLGVAVPYFHLTEHWLAWVPQRFVRGAFVFVDPACSYVPVEAIAGVTPLVITRGDKPGRFMIPPTILIPGQILRVRFDSEPERRRVAMIVTVVR